MDEQFLSDILKAVKLSWVGSVIYKSQLPLKAIINFQNPSTYCSVAACGFISSLCYGNPIEKQL